MFLVFFLKRTNTPFDEKEGVVGSIKDCDFNYINTLALEDMNVAFC
jgi:hypothetical protein